MIHAAQIAAGLLAVGHPAARAMPLYTDPLPTTYPPLEPGYLRHPVEYRNAPAERAIPTLPASLAFEADPIGYSPELASQLAHNGVPIGGTDVPVAGRAAHDLVDKRSAISLNPDSINGEPVERPGQLSPAEVSAIDAGLPSGLAERGEKGPVKKPRPPNATHGGSGGRPPQARAFITGAPPVQGPGMLNPAAESSLDRELSEEGVFPRAATESYKPGETATDPRIQEPRAFVTSPPLYNEPGRLAPGAQSTFDEELSEGLIPRVVTERAPQATFSHPRLGPMIPPPVPVPASEVSLFEGNPGALPTPAPQDGLRDRELAPSFYTTKTQEHDGGAGVHTPIHQIGFFMTHDAALEARAKLMGDDQSGLEQEPLVNVSPAPIESGFQTVALPHGQGSPLPGDAEPLNARAPVVTPAPGMGQRADVGDPFSVFGPCSSAIRLNNENDKRQIGMVVDCGIPNGAL